MIIEIRGVGIENKGAYLMLKAILQEFRERKVNATIIAEPSRAYPPEVIANDGLKTRLKTFKKGIEFSPFISIVPKSIRTKLGWYLVKDADYVFDASGFFMGDQWSVGSIEHKLGRDINALKSRNSKVILLPQAFGPFKKADVKAAASKILDGADIVFARDTVSYNEVKSNFTIDGKLHMAPDFTNLLEAPAYSRDLSKTIAIIPNQKLVEQKVASNENDYQLFLKKVIEQVKAIGLEPVFLIHAGKKDFQISQQVNAMLDKPIEIINEQDPLVIKSIIKGCRGVVTGRFHGLVSALCQAVPVLATSWSHKYEMLMGDYSYSEGLMPVTNDANVIADKMKLFVDEQQYKQVKEKLAEAAKVQKKLAKQMWDTVFEKVMKAK